MNEIFIINNVYKTFEMKTSNKLLIFYPNYFYLYHSWLYLNYEQSVIII
jgi:hypothetical protein